MSAAFFKGMMPALMTPCGADRRPDFDALVGSLGVQAEPDILRIPSGERQPLLQRLKIWVFYAITPDT
ncbi:MAG: hypothetical protein ACPG5C_05930 [Alphaproteobacteria bacterium]